MRKEKQVACPETGSVRSNRRKGILTGVLALTLMFSAAGGLTGQCGAFGDAGQGNHFAPGSLYQQGKQQLFRLVLR